MAKHKSKDETPGEDTKAKSGLDEAAKDSTTEGNPKTDVEVTNPPAPPTNPSGLQEAAKDSRTENNPAPTPTPAVSEPAKHVTGTEQIKDKKLIAHVDKELRSRIEALDKSISESPTAEIRAGLESLKDQLVSLFE